MTPYRYRSHIVIVSLSLCSVTGPLHTLDKLDGVNGAVPMTLDKLPSIRGDLVKLKWTFVKLVEALNQWCRRNPIEKPSELNDDSFSNKKRDSYFMSLVRNLINVIALMAIATNTKKNNCAKVTLTSTRKQLLPKKRLCFNCAIIKPLSARVKPLVWSAKRDITRHLWF